jgi:hypothetical protein
MRGPIHYYGMDESLKVVELGLVTIDQALQAVEERFARLKPLYETGEEALAETMFGFSQSEDTFIEICIHTPTQIALKLEIPRSKKFWIFQSVYQKETELKSKAELVEQIRAFFSMEIEAYREFLERYCH